MPLSLTIGRVGPGKLRLPPRSTDNAIQSFVQPVIAAPELRKVGPGKLRLPPRSSGLTAILFLSGTDGFVPVPGPGVGPSSRFQFVQQPRATTQPTTTIAISGLAISVSTTYGALGIAQPNVGFIPQGGPGIAPFGNNQFQQPPLAYSNPSPTGIDLSPGLAFSTSVAYGGMRGSGVMGGLGVSHSVAYGSATVSTQGAIFGLAISVSTSYGSVLGLGSIGGLSVSTSLAVELGISGNFQPLIPMTATTDVRLNIGYQPWHVEKDDVIG